MFRYKKRFTSKIAENGGSLLAIVTIFANKFMAIDYSHPGMDLVERCENFNKFIEGNLLIILVFICHVMKMLL